MLLAVFNFFGYFFLIYFGLRFLTKPINRKKKSFDEKLQRSYFLVKKK
jgi:hypothetical protein